MVLLAVVGCQQIEAVDPTTHVIEVTDATFKDEVLNSNQPVIVEFWAPWCRPCLEMQPDLERIASDDRSRVKVARIRIDQNPTSASTYGVDSPPCLLVFVNGELAKVRKGRHSWEELKALVPE